MSESSSFDEEEEPSRIVDFPSFDEREDEAVMMSDDEENVVNEEEDEQDEPDAEDEEEEEEEDEEEDEDEDDEEVLEEVVEDVLEEEEDDMDDEKSESKGESNFTVGGKIETPSFALLAGKKEESSEIVSCQIPITNIPVTLGRQHANKDKTFIPLGNHKSLSRNHCIIYFRDVEGGRVGQYKDNSTELIYKSNDDAHPDGKGRQAMDVDVQDIIRPSDKEDDGDEAESSLPSTGFFVIECLSKNKITVGGKKVEQGQVALLRNKTPILIATHSVYFLLPTDAEFSSTLQIPCMPKKSNQHSTKKRKHPGQSAQPDHAPSSNPTTKKIKSTSSDHHQTPHSPTPSTTPTGRSSMVADLEKLPAKQLLSRMTQHILADQWDRKSQMIGSAISLHAVRDAAKSRELQSIARKDGVCRGDVMKWIESSPVYGHWVAQMLTKMELKSYQSNIGKALLKGGYIRTGTTGRHVRWTLPKDIVMHEVEEDDGEESGSSDEEEANTNEPGEKQEEDEAQSENEEEENSVIAAYDNDEGNASPKEDEDEDDDDDDDERSSGSDISV